MIEDGFTALATRWHGEEKYDEIARYDTKNLRDAVEWVLSIIKAHGPIEGDGTVTEVSITANDPDDDTHIFCLASEQSEIDALIDSYLVS